MAEQKLFYVMLIGLPGSGKSFIREKIMAAVKFPGNVVQVSSDDYIDSFAWLKGKTYSEVFQDYSALANSNMHTDRQFALKAERSVIHDQTNLSVGSRRKKLAGVGPNYVKIALNMLAPRSLCEERAAARVGKNITQAIYDHMERDFQPATLDEGFDVVIPEHLWKACMRPWLKEDLFDANGFPLTAWNA